MENEQQLIQDILRGNRHRFQEIVAHYGAQVHSVAIKVADNPRDAEDISQEVFLQVYRSLPQFQGEAKLSTWMYRITMNKALDYKRKQKPQAPDAALAQLPDMQAATPEEALLQKSEQEWLHANIMRLPAAYREIVYLYYFKELSYRQIADKLGIAVKTVESRLYRARGLLQHMRKGETG
ncbi:RNA polymerase sigma factor [Ectobacillus ponti]|uniref:Sigma-70 family RNA polymerase sigma factor n=1 Tax=Ectobacillus ponti TaxID=2961894 RepID=A0AA41X7C6_9BACI|nr:sigma-70 family RNA polymerase sigma factor [Ectobacillus ponti]MCP8968195.1 sigma-70 family RNA polymerase sigma factor [Ectobacillus ponti]